MDGKVLVGVVLLWCCGGLSVSAYDHELCPKHCKCTENISGDGVARCTVLDDRVQRFAPFIKHLVVQNGRLATTPNGASTLNDNIFGDLVLNDIKSIKIANSSLQVIHPRAFSGLSYLEELDLSHNLISKLDPKAFVSNIRLDKLRLNGNPLRLPEDGSSNRFLESATITELDLSECGIERLGQAAFAGLHFVKVLFLTANRITELKPGSLANLGLLTELNLDRNLISKIEPRAFDNLKQLYSLSLRANPLKSLNGIDITQLSDLDVSQCQIRQLTATSLAGLNQLVSLNASHNSIESIDERTFRNMSDLAYLDLSHNNLRGPLSPLLFDANKNLETISLSGNQQLYSAGRFVSALDKLYMYDISDCGLADISEETFAGMNYLATLNASGNNLQLIEPATFRNLKHLIKLDMSRNKLRSLPPEVFEENGKLQRLFLGGNLFHHVPAFALVPATKLSLLDMSDNRMTYLWNSSRLEEGGHRYPLARLVYLNLAGNRLKRFRVSDFNHLESLTKIDISDNPIECNSDFAHFVEWLIEQRVMSQKGPAAVVASFPMEMRARGEADEEEDDQSHALAWDQLTRQICPPPLHGTQHDDNDDDDDKTESNVITIDEGADHSLHSLEIVGIDNDGAMSVWPIVLAAIVSMCLLCVVFNMIGLFLARKRYNLVSYKSQFASPLGGMSHVRRADSTHIYHKLYEDCSVPNTPIVKNTKARAVISYLSGSLDKTPIQDV